MYVGGDDYLGGAFPITIHSGYQSATLPLLINHDQEPEATENFMVSITLDSASNACGNIEAGDKAIVEIADETGKSTSNVHYSAGPLVRPNLRKLAQQFTFSINYSTFWY